MSKVKLKVGDLYSLNQLETDSEAEIVDVVCDNKLMLRRLLELGLTKGSCLRVKQKSPFGGLVSFAIRDYELALRSSELKKIIVRLKK